MCEGLIDKGLIEQRSHRTKEPAPKEGLPLAGRGLVSGLVRGLVSVMRFS